MQKDAFTEATEEKIPGEVDGSWIYSLRNYFDKRLGRWGANPQRWFMKSMAH